MAERMLIDPECETLAEHFLPDGPEDRITDLAEQIQIVVDFFLQDEVPDED